MPSKWRITVTLPLRIKNILEELAAKQNRSVSNLAATILIGVVDSDFSAVLSLQPAQAHQPASFTFLVQQNYYKLKQVGLSGIDEIADGAVPTLEEVELISSILGLDKDLVKKLAKYSFPEEFAMSA